ncbi:MAG: hypothetical protein ACTH1D_04320 [Mycobacteriaceae bacterium]|uniref:hypothetical protein n=1 Tax=Corynebacterium sp. TaxID=1720 RepID=UPI003F9854A4
MSTSTVTDLNILVRAGEVAGIRERISAALDAAGARGHEIVVREITLACEPDNMLVTEFQQRFDRPAVVEQVHHLVVTASWGDSGEVPGTADITATVVGCLPPAPDGSTGLWFGQTRSVSSSE